MDAVNHQFRLASRPEGMVGREHFDYVEETLPELQDGQVLVKIDYISLDPAMRGWMAEGRSYIPPVQIGEMMRAGTVGTIVESKGQKLAAGDHVSGWLGVQEYAICDENAVFKVDTSTDPADQVPRALWDARRDGLLRPARRGRPQRGRDRGRLRRRRRGRQRGRADRQNSRAVVSSGIAGGPEKCAWIVDELGFDAAIDYKSEDVGDALAHSTAQRASTCTSTTSAARSSTAALARLARGARVVICGAISQYNKLDSMRRSLQLHVACSSTAHAWRASW